MWKCRLEAERVTQKGCGQMRKEEKEAKRKRDLHIQPYFLFKHKLGFASPASSLPSLLFSRPSFNSLLLLKPACSHFQPHWVKWLLNQTNSSGEKQQSLTSLNMCKNDKSTLKHLKETCIFWACFVAWWSSFPASSARLNQVFISNICRKCQVLLSAHQYHRGRGFCLELPFRNELGETFFIIISHDGTLHTRIHRSCIKCKAFGLVHRLDIDTDTSLDIQDLSFLLY